MTAPAIRIAAATHADLTLVHRLADVIWRQHYPGIITAAQIDYMLARGYSREALSAFLDRPDAGIAIASVDGEPVGFAAWYRTAQAASMKLDKLYVLPSVHGKGIGRMLIAHVEQAARSQGCDTVVLNVNKNNAGAIAAYERCGFAKREAVVVDIGGGFVMDDYVMAKRLVAA